MAYLNISDSSQHCPYVQQEITTPNMVCGRRSTTGGSSTTPLLVSRCVGGIIYWLPVWNSGCPSNTVLSQSTVPMLMELVSHVASPPTHLDLCYWHREQPNDPFSTMHACVLLGALYNRNTAPSFVGQNYFCETAIIYYSRGQRPIFGQMVTPCGMDRGVVPLAPLHLQLTTMVQCTTTLPSQDL